MKIVSIPLRVCTAEIDCKIQKSVLKVYVVPPPKKQGRAIRNCPLHNFYRRFGFELLAPISHAKKTGLSVLYDTKPPNYYYICSFIYLIT